MEAGSFLVDSVIGGLAIPPLEVWDLLVATPFIKVDQYFSGTDGHVGEDYQ